MAPAGSTSTNRAWFSGLAVIALVWGILAAALGAWTCDDAFISFRYAKNLVESLGLVYNAGERVEGYSNLLWTLWIAVGLRFGADAEAWSMAWGVVLHAGSIGLLVLRCARRGRGAHGLPWVPIAALAAAAHSDWSVFATSGLETSLMTFLLLLGFTIAIDAPPGGSRLSWAGLVFGLACLTRPEGALLAAVTGVLLAGGRGGLRAAARFSWPWLALCLAQFAGRLSYYGDLFPNTYYAKSAYLSWYDQGWTYVSLYFMKYWILAVGVIGGCWLLVDTRLRRRTEPPSPREPWEHELQLAVALSMTQTLFVLRVGGDFMFARFLVPAAPFMLIAVEIGALQLCRGRRDSTLAVATAALLAVGFTPHPFAGTTMVDGIVHERLNYPIEKCQAQRRKGEKLRPLLAGLPVRVAFTGSEARVVYYSQVPVAIECSAGLTDRFIAHRRLEHRGRVGHEKHPTAAYLKERGVQIGLHSQLVDELALRDSLPAMPMRFGTLRLCLLGQNEALFALLEHRGARIDGLIPRGVTSAPAVAKAPLARTGPP